MHVHFRIELSEMSDCVRLRKKTVLIFIGPHRRVGSGIIFTFKQIFIKTALVQSFRVIMLIRKKMCNDSFISLFITQY